MPPNGWQTFSDAYPQVGGGVRAFFKATPISVSGIGTIAKERVIGLHARGGVAARSGSPAELVDRYLATYLFDSAAAPGAKARPKIYRMDGSNNETTWTEINRTSGSSLWNFATSDNNAPRKTSFKFFHNLAGSPNDDWVLAVIRYVGAQPNGPGLYRFNYNDLSSAQKGIEIKMANSTVFTTGPITVHQARVLVGGGGAGNDTIYYSDPGAASTSSATGFLQVDPSQDLPKIIGLSPSPPSDLFVLRQGAPPVLVQGLIASQTSQVMAEGIISSPGEQDIVRTPEGYAFISHDGYIYLTDGVTFTALSQQLAGFQQQSDIVHMGDLSYIEEFLFGPIGFVYHFPTKSWFRQTQIAGAFHNVERSLRQIWGPDNTGVSFALNKLSPVPATSPDRLSTYTIKSAPLHAGDGRRIGIREVQIYLRSYDANATVAVTVNGTTRTVTCSTTGRQQLSFLFVERAEVLDVQVVPTAGSAANEAPSIEVLRVGFEPGTHLSNQD